MALTEDIRRLLGFEDGPENNAEIQFKIKPLGSVGATVGVPSDPSVTGATEAGSGVSGVGGASQASGALGAVGAGASNTAINLPAGFGPQGASIVPQQQQVKNQNPSLVTHPLGAQTDDIYEAAVAQLQYDTQSRYAQLLQELGFVGDSGQFMPGTLETEATRQRYDLERQRDLSLQEVIEGAVRGGTVFSGRRAQNQAQAQQPFDSAISELTTRLSRELANRYQGLGDITRQFELGRGSLLAEASERIKAALLAQQGIGGEPPPGPPGGGQQHPEVQPSNLPPGAQIVNDPQRGSYVAVNGVRVGRIVNGVYVQEVTRPRQVLLAGLGGLGTGMNYPYDR